MLMTVCYRKKFKSFLKYISSGKKTCTTSSILEGNLKNTTYLFKENLFPLFPSMINNKNNHNFQQLNIFHEKIKMI